MARSLFGSVMGTMHRGVSRVLSPARDASGRPLKLWWPVAAMADPRAVASAYHDPPIPAFIGQGRRTSTPTNIGLPAIPQVTVTFGAELAHFPTAVPPEEGVIFLAGPRLEEATMYRVLNATEVAGLVEIEAAVER